MQFLVEAVVLSLFGGILGVALGLGLAAFVTQLLKVPFLLDPDDRRGGVRVLGAGRRRVRLLSRAPGRPPRSDRGPAARVMRVAGLVRGMNVWVSAQLLALLTLANGSPVIAKRVLGDRLAYPLDGGLILPDGAPLFGKSKTIRGIVLAVIVTAAGAPLVGVDWLIGALVGAMAMLGDLLSSFVKRRLKMASSSQATGLDQIPKSLFPLLAASGPLSLTCLEIAAVVMIFLVGEIVLSRILFRLRVRDRPY